MCNLGVYGRTPVADTYMTVKLCECQIIFITTQFQLIFSKDHTFCVSKSISFGFEQKQIRKSNIMTHTHTFFILFFFLPTDA